MNLLETICKELGVEIGEKWEGNDGYKYRISKNGEIFLYDKRGFYTGSRGFGRWESVFNGELKPVWKPTSGEFYYYPNPVLAYPDVEENHIYDCAPWTNEFWDEFRLEHNLVYKTKEEAKEAAKKMLKAIKEDK